MRTEPLILFPMRDRPVPRAYRSVLELHYTKGWELIENDLPHHFEIIRGRLGLQALQTEHEWFIWWDDDVPALPETAVTLVNRAKALAKATDKHMILTSIFRPGKARRIEDLRPDDYVPRGLMPHQGICEASHLGFAMVVMHRSVLEDLPHSVVRAHGVEHGTWFHGVTEDGGYLIETGAFSYRVINRGWTIWCDTNTFVPHGMPSIGGEEFGRDGEGLVV